MKGPGLRSNFAGSRLWRCPQTGHELLTKPSVTSMASPFAAGKWMIAVDPPRNYRAVVPIEDFVSIVEAEPAVIVVEEVVVTETVEEIVVETEMVEEEEEFGGGLE